MRRTWAPSIGIVAVAWAFVVVVLLLALLADDPPSRLFGFVAAAFAGTGALVGTVARPRLAVDDTGVAVRGPFGTRHWPWSAVHRIRVTRHRRLGREVAMLELDTIDDDGDERLTVFGRIDLDAHPDEVLAEIQSLRGLR